MKITCDSCGSKYTIADDKVQGRKVKVRCKNCKANILVDGTGDGSSSSEPPEADAPAPNQWTVNLSDEDSRDMTTEEIVAGWATGLVNEDAYVWRDGMADWKPILEVAELKMKLVTRTAASPRPAETVAEAPRAPSPGLSSGGAALGGLGSSGGGLVGGGLGGVAPRAAAPAGRAQDDLFGQNWGASADHDDEGKRPTGARNENSVLFSLDALKGSKPEVKPKKPAITTSEDLFSMGTMPGGGLLNANVDLLTAPALAPPPAPVSVKGSLAAPKKGGSGLLIGAAVIALAGLGGGYYFMSRSSSAETDAIRSAQAEAEQKLKDAEAARKKLEEDLAKIRAEAQARGEDPAEAEKRAKDALAKAEVKEPAKAEPPKETAGATKEPTASSSSPSASPGPAKEPTKSTTPPKETSSGGGGKSFDVAAAKSSLSAAAANASSCAQPGGPKGSGKVQVTFAPSGRVTTATIVEGPFGGTSVGGCISSTFKRARVPAFDGGPTSVAKGFKI
jgi:predicted Zn finger-like uncharacterized protein